MRAFQSASAFSCFCHSPRRCGRGSAGRQWTRSGWRAGSQTRMGLWMWHFRMLWADSRASGLPSRPRGREEVPRPAAAGLGTDMQMLACFFGPSMLRTERSPNSGGGNWVCCVLCPSLIKCLLFWALGVNFLLSDVCSVGFGEARPVRGPRWGLWGLMCFSCKCAWCLGYRGEGGCDSVSVGT